MMDHGNCPQLNHFILGHPERSRGISLLDLSTAVTT